MPAMTKHVNVRATVAVRNTNPPMYGTYKNIIMTTGDILKCLVKRAFVEEILPDGSTVKLNYKNYYLDNGAGLDAKPEKAGIVSKKEAEIKGTKKAEKEVKAEAAVVEKAPEIAFNEEPIPQAEEPANEEVVDAVVEAVENKDDAVAEIEVAETEVVEEAASEVEMNVAADATNEEIAEEATAVEEKTTTSAKKKNTSKKKK